MNRVPRARTLALAGLAALAAAKAAGDAMVRAYETVDSVDLRLRDDVADVGGVRLHYADRGSGPTVVLLHGLGATAMSFRLVIPALTERFRVIAPDLPGHGLSARDAPSLSLTSHARFLAGLLDGLGVERASIAGHSMGGSIAQRFAAMYPDRVARLALIASTTDDYFLRAKGLSPFLAPFLPLFVTLAVNNRYAREQKLRLLVAHREHITPAVRAEWAAPARVRGHVRAYQTLMRDRAHDRRIDLAALPPATLVVWGDSDRLVSIEHGRRLAAGIPGARLKVIAHAGHLVPEEQPQVLSALLIEHFLGGGSRAAVAQEAARS